MDFVEEKTPGGISIKIFLNSWNFLAFDKKGQSIYPDEDQKTQLYKVPLFIFLSNNIHIKNPPDQAYKMVKIRKYNMIIDYMDIREHTIKYFFVECGKKLDMIPIRIIKVKTIASLIREIDVKLGPDYIVIDSDQSENDRIIIKSKFKTAEIVNIDYSNNVYFINRERSETADERSVDLNMLSANPVYLARIHLGSMHLSKLNQLLLDFEMNAVDAEYIYHFIFKVLEKEKDPAVIKNRIMLTHLRNAFLFYMYLIQKDNDKVREMIESISDVKDMTPYQTLILKAKSMFPGRDDQLLYTDYENILMERKAVLSESGFQPSAETDVDEPATEPELPEIETELLEDLDLSDTDEYPENISESGVDIIDAKEII